MDNTNVRARSSQSDSAVHADDAQRRYGVNWPFPPVDGPVAWTAKQEKAYINQQLSEAEEAPF